MYINVLTYYMKQISIREFQLHAEQYLKDLPLMLTRYNMPVAIVQLPETIAVNGVVEFDEPKKMDIFQKLKKQIENKEEVVDVHYGEVKYTAPTPPEEPEFTYSKEDL